LARGWLAEKGRGGDCIRNVTSEVPAAGEACALESLRKCAAEECAVGDRAVRSFQKEPVLLSFQRERRSCPSESDGRQLPPADSNHEKMLTFSTTAKPFVGQSGIQQNALRSRTLVHPDAEIILFGDELKEEHFVCFFPSGSYMIERAKKIAINCGNRARK
jgi:hypothetical protein